MVRDDHLLRELEDRQRREAEEVELDEADRLDVVLVELAHRAVAARLHVERAEVGDLAGRDQHAAGVHADVADDALDALGHREQLGDLLLVLLALLDLGRLAPRVDHAVVRHRRRTPQGHALAGRRRHQLRDAVDVAVAHAEDAADVAQRRLRRHRAEGRDLADRIAPVLLLHVVDHAVAIGLAEVDVEVGHRDPLRIQEAFEQQVVAKRVEAGDVERIGDQRAGARAAAGADRAAVALGPVDEVGDDQEVAREAHLQDRLDLEVEALDVARPLGLPHRVVGIELAQPHLEALVRGDPEVLRHRQALALHHRRFEVGQLRLAEDERQIAALRDLDRVAHGARQVGEQRLHLRLRLEVLLAAEAADAARVRQHLAFGDADPGLVRLVVVRGQELDRMRRDDRQPQRIRELHGRGDMRLVVRQAGALQLQIEALRKDRVDAPRDRLGPRQVAAQQRLPDRAVLGPGQHDQPLVQLDQPRPLQPGLAALRVVQPAARQQLAEVVVALAVLRQHDDPARRALADVGLEPEVGADDRLHAGAPRGTVELDRTEQVRQVGDRERPLPIGRGRRDRIVDPQGAVDDRILGVRAQVNEGHRRILGRGERPKTAALGHKSTC